MATYTDEEYSQITNDMLDDFWKRFEALCAAKGIDEPNIQGAMVNSFVTVLVAEQLDSVPDFWEHLQTQVEILLSGEGRLH